jgi:hypothetical protein
MKQHNQALYDPELPDANAVMASLCCVAAQYAGKPSLALAELAADLSRKLTAPQYAESRWLGRSRSDWSHNGKPSCMNATITHMTA